MPALALPATFPTDFPMAPNPLLDTPTSFSNNVFRLLSLFCSSLDSSCSLAVGAVIVGIS